MHNWMWRIMVMGVLGSCTAPPSPTTYPDLLFTQRRFGDARDSVWVQLEVDYLEEATVYTYSADSTQSSTLRTPTLTYFDDGRLYLDRALLTPTQQWGPDAAPLWAYEWRNASSCGSAWFVFSPTYGVLASNLWTAWGSYVLDVASHADSVVLRKQFPMESDSSLMWYLRLVPLPPPPPPPGWDRGSVESELI